MKRIMCVLLTLVLLCAGLALAEDPVLEATYQRAVAMMEAGEYDMAVAIFEMLGEYKDAAAQILVCRNAKLQQYYDRAQALFEAGEFDAAKEVFLMLGDYKDSAVQAIRCDTQKKQKQYDAADALAAQGAYEKAREAFRLLGDFSDSPARVEQMNEAILAREYAAAAALEAEGRYEEAIAAYEALKDYGDAAERIQACRQQLYIAELGGKIEAALADWPFDPAETYKLLNEAREYGLDEERVADWYEAAYDLEAIVRYPECTASLDLDLDADGQAERIISTPTELTILKKGPNGLEAQSSLAAPAYDRLDSQVDPSKRRYILGMQGSQMDIYLLEAAPAKIVTADTGDDRLTIEWTPTGFVLNQRLTDMPLREKKTEYIVLSGSMFNALESPVSVDMDIYPDVSSAFALVTLYQEAIQYQNPEELKKLVADAADPAGLEPLNAWIADKVIDRADIALWNEETNDFLCVVFSGKQQISLRVVRTDDGQFQLLGLM